MTSLDVRDTSLHLSTASSCDITASPLTLTKGSQRILAFLTLADREVERGAAAYQLWPDETEDRAVANLRSALWRIRQQPAPLVRHERRHESVAPRRVGRRSRWRPTSSVLRPRRRRSDDSDHDLRGDLLPDWYDEWVLTERERLRQVRLHALEEAARRFIGKRGVRLAIDAGLHAVAMEPLRESAHELVISRSPGRGQPVRSASTVRATRRPAARGAGGGAFSPAA